MSNPLPSHEQMRVKRCQNMLLPLLLLWVRTAKGQGEPLKPLLVLSLEEPGQWHTVRPEHMTTFQARRGNVIEHKLGLCSGLLQRFNQDTWKWSKNGEKEQNRITVSCKIGTRINIVLR